MQPHMMALHYFGLIALGFGVGAFGTLIGAGGGILIVPLLSYLLNFPVVIATATAQFIVAILTFTSVLMHIHLGSFHYGSHRVAALGMGVLLGAQLGAHLSTKIKGRWIIRSLALALAVVGIRILLAALKSGLK